MPRVKKSGILEGWTPWDGGIEWRKEGVGVNHPGTSRRKPWHPCFHISSKFEEFRVQPIHVAIDFCNRVPILAWHNILTMTNPFFSPLQLSTNHFSISQK